MAPLKVLLPSNNVVVFIFGLCLAVFLCIYVRRLWMHPLSKHPGPKSWALSRIPYVLSLIRGNLNNDLYKMHVLYGDVVRIAPNELSFATEKAWKDIYSHRPGHQEASKDPIWYIAPENMPQNIVTTSDINVRARMRRLLSPSFNTQSLMTQAPVLEKYADMVVANLETLCNDHTQGNKPASVNMLDWCNFYTMDVIGDLAMGESFHCLDESSYHPWVRTMYMFFKGMIFAAAIRFFPGAWFVAESLVPKRLRQQQKYHTDFTNAKILQRLELDSTRPDLVTPFLRDMKNSPDKMSLGEIQSTFALILVAGSETTATTLVGTFYKLACFPHVQEKLYALLRLHFSSNHEITVEATKDIDYLEAVVNEALRLCYAIPGGLPRIAPNGGDTYAGHYVPGGTSISIRPYVILHKEEYFRNAWDFVPERWLPLEQRPQEYSQDVLGASQPFSVGPTNCIGKPLAWAEMKVLLAKVIWHFKLSMTQDRPFTWEKLRMMMVVEKEPLWLHIEKRKAS